MEEKRVFLKLSDEATYTAHTSHGALSVGEKGFKPMELLLTALAGCSGVDVYTILKKKRQEVEDIEIEVSGLRRDNHPRVYERIKLTYRIKGKVDKKAVEQAIKLSVEKYCSVYAMLSRVARIEVDYELWEG